MLDYEIGCDFFRLPVNFISIRVQTNKYYSSLVGYIANGRKICFSMSERNLGIQLGTTYQCNHLCGIQINYKLTINLYYVLHTSQHV